MSALNCDCPSTDGVSACSPLPLAFARLRYFFGKRMGVADFVDEQLYHAAKMRFHGQHAHGAGVLCGLRLEAFGATGARVGKGAALDRCGREIVVGFDQCIDVDAWVDRERKARQEKNPNSTWPQPDLDADGALSLAVVLAYAECNASPEPAPRDPCSCDNGGCDYGRVREGFTLELKVRSDAGDALAPTAFPAPDRLSQALAGSVSGAAFEPALAGEVTMPPPDPSGHPYLLLGGLLARIDGNNRVTSVQVVQLEQAPPLLLQTAALQELTLRLLAAGIEPGALVDGAPQVRQAVFVSDDGEWMLGTAPRVEVSLTGEILKSTLPAEAQLHRLDVTQGWVTVNVDAPVYTAGAGATPPSIRVDILDALVAPVSGTQLYRLSLPVDQATPICDALARPLLPLRLSWDFSINTGGEVAPATFA